MAAKGGECELPPDRMRPGSDYSIRFNQGGEEALVSAMQLAGHQPFEQAIVKSGLQGGTLEHTLIDLVKALEAVEIVRRKPAA